MSKTDLTAYAEDLYRRVGDIWNERKHELFNGQCGYSLLSGPPLYEPDLMIIGANPGFGKADVGGKPHTEPTWPERSYINDAQLSNWRLAHRIRDLFSSEALKPMLENAMQTNFQFFASGSVSRASPLRWDALPEGIKSDLKTFCQNEITKLVYLSKPKLVLIVGFASFDAFCHDKVNLTWNWKSHRLLSEGRFGGVKALAVPHLSTARIRTEDWLNLKREIEKAIVALPS